MMKKWAIILTSLVVVFIALKAPNESIESEGELVAYRGGGQYIDYNSMDNTSCAAANLIQSDNQFIENTLESISEAVKTGFDVIHLNVRITKDKQFVIFHDWKLNCATDGNGKVSDFTMAELSKLDAGYGYTYDKQQTFPWRNIGLKIASLQQVLSLYPHQQFWFNLKDHDPKVIELFSQHVKALSSNPEQKIVFIASDDGASYYKMLNPDAMVTSVGKTKSCFVDYMLYGWTRFFPESCKNTILLVPPSKSSFLWGWPDSLATRMAEHGTQVYLWGQHSQFNSNYDHRVSGIGVVTGDINYFRSNL